MSRPSSLALDCRDRLNPALGRAPNDAENFAVADCCSGWFASLGGLLLQRGSTSIAGDGSEVDGQDLGIELRCATVDPESSVGRSDAVLFENLLDDEADRVAIAYDPALSAADFELAIVGTVGCWRVGFLIEVKRAGPGRRNRRTGRSR